MNIFLFIVTCPACSGSIRTRAQSKFICPYCNASLTGDDVSIIGMDRIDEHDYAMLKIS